MRMRLLCSCVAAVVAGAIAVPTSSTSALAPAGRQGARVSPVQLAVPHAHRYRTHARQVIVVSAASWGSTRGWLRTYERVGDHWGQLKKVRANLGYGALVRAPQRVQSTGTTPAGKFAITESFGRRADPGTAMPYIHVNAAHWWVQDRRSRYYNEMRRGGQGGFARRTSGYNASEHLASMGRQYDYVAVIDFNRPDPVIGRGSGIFLHASKGEPTAGCVSIRHRTMRSVLRWLEPGAQIVIGPRGWLRGG